MNFKDREKRFDRQFSIVSAIIYIVIAICFVGIFLTLYGAIELYQNPESMGEFLGKIVNGFNNSK